MITIEEACETVLKQINGVKISRIRDVGDSFLFGIMNAKTGAIPDTGGVLAVNKTSGELWTLLPKDFQKYSNKIEKSKKVKVPKKYK